MWNGIGWYGFIGPTTSTTDISLIKRLLFELEKIAQSNLQEKKNDKAQVLLIPFTDDHIFFQYKYLKELFGKYRKNSSLQCRQCSAILFWNRSHASVLSTPPRKTK